MIPGTIPGTIRGLLLGLIPRYFSFNEWNFHFPPHSLHAARTQSVLPTLSHFSVVGRESNISPFFHESVDKES